MNTSIPKTTARIATKDFKLKDLNIKKGTILALLLLPTHQNPNNFENPDTFEPGRFSEERKKKWHRLAHNPFSTGKRGCVGKNFGDLLSRMIILHLTKGIEFSKPENHTYIRRDEFVLRVDNPEVVISLTAFK